MTMHTKVSGTWKGMDGFTRVSGSWKRLLHGWERVSGVWKRFYQYLVVEFTAALNGGALSFGSPVTVQIIVRRDGTCFATPLAGDGESDWAIPNAPTVGDSFHMRLTKSGGTDPDSGPTLNTWVAVTSDRTWEWTATTVSFTGTMALSDDGGSTTLDTTPVSVDIGAI
jgi:hypothetical protein